MTETRQALQPATERLGAMVTTDVRQRRSIVPTTVGEAMDMAKMLAKGKFSVPTFLYENPGDCLQIVTVAMETGLNPYALAREAYLVQGKGPERKLEFSAKAIHAIVQASGMLDGPIQLKFSGEGEALTCSVTGIVQGHKMTETYQIRTIMPRNSPLWTTQPRQQLGYYSERAWCRLHVPGAMLGLIAPEDPQIVDVTPAGATPPPATSETERVARALGVDKTELGEVSPEPEPEKTEAMPVFEDADGEFTTSDEPPQARQEQHTIVSQADPANQAPLDYDPETGEITEPDEPEQPPLPSDIEIWCSDMMQNIMGAQTKSDLKELGAEIKENMADLKTVSKSKAAVLRQTYIAQLEALK